MICPSCKGQKTTIVLALVKDNHGVTRDLPGIMACSRCGGVGEIESLESPAPACIGDIEITLMQPVHSLWSKLAVRRPWWRRVLRV
jgi:hypothetical protein